LQYLILFLILSADADIDDHQEDVNVKNILEAPEAPRTSGGSGSNAVDDKESDRTVGKNDLSRPVAVENLAAVDSNIAGSDNKGVSRNPAIFDQ
jgi:hypothetical protein